MKRYFYTFGRNGECCEHGQVSISPDNYVAGGKYNLEPTPVEDYVTSPYTYILSTEPLVNPFQALLEHL